VIAPTVRAPSEYRLRLRIDFVALTFGGTVEMDVPAGGPELVLDAEELTVSAVRRDGAAVEFRFDPAASTLTVPTPGGAAARVAVDFSGAVSTRTLSGLYRSRHGDDYVVSAQCEPTGARSIFPCVDRPDAKARLLLRVEAPSDLEVVANGPVESVRPTAAGWSERTFGSTPPMATYLFFVAVGKFDRREGRSRRAAIRVLAAPGRGDAADYALAAGGRILDAFEEYYAIPYPLPKLDLLAIEEHAFGAMENWGAISFQATRLLVDPTSSSFAARDVFETISHEVAHQWFGNLVTMSWWTDIWLNESFAALMETKITERLEPSLDARADFFLRVAGMAAAIDGDSLRSTHPVRAAVREPAEIGQIFDEISYGKGSSVLAMIDAYLGEERFRTGVTDYLRRFREGNATTDDLWRSLERASSEPVGAIAGPWIDRPGMPVVTGRLGPGGLELSQRRFGYLGSTAADPWPIPMVIDIDGRRERLLFDTSTRVVPVPPTATVHLNPGAVGFYRALYDRPLYDRLLSALPNRSGPDRWIVLEDLAAFLAAGDVDWATYDRFATALGGSADRLTVESIGGTLVGLALAYPEAPRIQSAAHRFFAAQSDRLGPEKRRDEPRTDGILRERVSFGRSRLDAGYARTLSDRFREWERVDPDLRLATAVGHARTAGADGYRELRGALERAVVDADRARLVRSLGWIAEPSLLRESLDFAISGGTNRSYLPPLIVQAASNPAGRSVVWPWFTERVDALADVFRGSGSLPVVLEHAVPAMALGRSEEVRAFFRGHPLPDGTRGVAKALERLEVQERLGRHLAGARTGIA